MQEVYLSSAIKLFRQYKTLAEKAFEQIDETHLFTSINAESNSIAIIIKHLSGNMISRWTNFLNEDGEKAWRNRDCEFENDINYSKAELLKIWHNGWNVLFETLEKLTSKDLEEVIFIRNEPHSVIEAINRQLTHYSYHVGQIVFISKMTQNKNWKNLSIPKGKSNEYNQENFLK